MPGLPVQAGAAGGLSRAGITEEKKPVARNATWDREGGKEAPEGLPPSASLPPAKHSPQKEGPATQRRAIREKGGQEGEQTQDLGEKGEGGPASRWKETVSLMGAHGDSPEKGGAPRVCPTPCLGKQGAHRLFSPLSQMKAENYPELLPASSGMGHCFAFKDPRLIANCMSKSTSDRT